MRDQWEYLATIAAAILTDDNRNALNVNGVDTSGMPINAPESLMPVLDDYGRDGWELVHMQPVFVGSNEDIAAFRRMPIFSNTVWTNSYFCVFKRPKPVD